MEKHGAKLNKYIYCTDNSLKRRITKVYTFHATHEQFVYGYDSEKILLTQLSRDYMFLPHFKEENVSSQYNQQNSLTWWYKKRKKGVKYVR